MCALALRTLLAAAVVVLAPLVAASQCGGERVAKDCSVSFGGLHVTKGLVTETVVPTCDKRPQQHDIQLRLQIEVGGEWVSRGRSVTVSKLPDQTGFDVVVKAPCTEGTWRTAVYVQGVGPNGDPFQHNEQGTPRHFTLVECAG